ncbi:hypothetical protein ZWY2020_035917 [Hordeum vulgare]|nr:hypothetical protein ZWY2020_035917 [Hordeum vulgare]
MVGWACRLPISALAKAARRISPDAKPDSAAPSSISPPPTRVRYRAATLHFLWEIHKKLAIVLMETETVVEILPETSLMETETMVETLLELPLDVLMYIFALLEIPDPIRAGSVCSFWHSVYTSLHSMLEQYKRP